MADYLMVVLRALAYILPAYIANATPVIVGGGKPLDLGKNFIDGRRIFGDHKTIRGFLGGMFFGTLMGFAIFYIYPLLDMGKIMLADALILAFLLSLGAHIGDLFGSFIKRRLNLRPGAPAPILDQAGFVIFALLIAYPIYPVVGLLEVLVILAITLIIHPLSNIIAYLLGLKDEPW